jgi:serine/threonine protein kinase
VRPREIDLIVCGPSGLFVIEAKSHEYVRGPFTGKWALVAEDQARRKVAEGGGTPFAKKLRENMLAAGGLVRESKDNRLNPYGGYPRAVFVFPDKAEIRLEDDKGFAKTDYLDGTMCIRRKSALPGFILSEPPPRGAPGASNPLTAEEARTILRMFTAGLRLDPTISGDYKIEDRGQPTTAPNGLPYVVCRLEHALTHDVWRGKWYDMRALGRKDRELFEAQVVRHALVLKSAKGHPNVNGYHDFRTDLVNEGYWVMEAFVDGKTLDDRLAGGAPALARPVHFMRQVAAGLAAIHRGGFVARGFNPGSILVERATDRPVLTNFETAKAADGGPTVTAGGALADDPYRAPELRVASGAQSETDVRADVYSWGAIFQRLVGGETGVGALPSSVADLVGRCLSPLRSQRPETMAEVLRELEAAL